MKIILSQLQRQIGLIEAQIASVVAAAARNEWKAEFAAPGSTKQRTCIGIARLARSETLPRLFIKLHKLQALLPPPPEIDIARLAAQAREFDERYRERSWSEPELAAA